MVRIGGAWLAVKILVLACVSWAGSAQDGEGSGDDDIGALIYTHANFDASLDDGGIHLVKFCDTGAVCADLEPKWAHIAKHYWQISEHLGEPVRVAEVECGHAPNVPLCEAITDGGHYPTIKLWKDGSKKSLVFDLARERALLDDEGRDSGGGFNVGRLFKWMQRVAKIGGRVESVTKREVKTVYEAGVSVEGDLTNAAGTGTDDAGRSAAREGGGGGSGGGAAAEPGTSSKDDAPAVQQQQQQQQRRNNAAALSEKESVSRDKQATFGRGGGNRPSRPAAEPIQAGCPRVDLDVREALKVVVGNECRKLAMSGGPVSLGQGMALGAVLGMNTALTRLSVGNPMGRKTVVIESSTDYSFAHEGGAWLESGGLVAVLEALATHPALSELYLGLNAFDGEGRALAALVALIRAEGSRIHTLHLIGNEIGPDGARAIAEALRGNRSLKALAIKSAALGPKGAKHFAELLAAEGDEACVLETLDLGANLVEDEGARALGEALATNGHLQTLGLYGSNIRTEGATALGQALRTNTALKTLYLVNNALGPKGAQALAKALPANLGLENLYAAGCGIGDVGASWLLHALERNAFLTELSFGVGDWHWEGHDRVKELLARNKAWAGSINRDLLALYAAGGKGGGAREEKLEKALDACAAENIELKRLQSKMGKKENGELDEDGLTADEAQMLLDEEDPLAGQ
jgi:hypothetical protein